MPVLHLADVPPEVYEELRRRAATHQTTTEAEAVELLRYSLARGTVSPSQAELLEELHRRRFAPPPGTPDSVELLREDRAR